MEYSTSGSSLSMRGGDDFTSINEILDRAVLLDTTQTITGSKVFADTTTQQFNGEVRFGTDGFQFAEGSLRIGANTALSIDVASLDKMNISSSTTTLDNTTTNLRSGGTTKYTQNATASTLTNATINLQDATPTTRFTQTNGTTTITNTNIGTNGILTQTGSATLSGTTITLQDATPTTRFTQTNGTTTITNTDIATNGILTQTGNFTAKGTTITLQDTTPTTHYLQSSTATSLTNDTINLSSGGVVDPKYRQTGTLTIIDNDEIRLRYRVANKLVQTSVATTITNTDIATNGILTQTGDFTAKGATITLQDATPTTHFLQTSTATTINNTTTNIQSGGANKITTNATDTSITNANILYNATTEQRIQVNGGDKFISIVGSTTIQDVIMALSSTSGGLFLSSSTGKVDMRTNNTASDAVLIRNSNTGAGGMRIETLGTTGTLVVDSAGTFNANTNAGKNSLSSTTGQIELKTGATTNTGINIENSSATTGGITLKTNGTTGDILLTSGDAVSINSTSTSTEGILLKQNGTGGVRILSSTNAPLLLGTGTNNYATVSSGGVGATEYWVGSGGANSFPLISVSPLMWFSTQTTGQTTSQCRVGSFANNDTAETFIRYRLPYRARIRAMTLLSDTETINALQTYIHISVDNGTGADTTPSYAHWIYDAGVANAGDIVVTDNGSMTYVADIPANSTFYVFMAYGSAGASINTVGTARTVPSEFQVHLWLQQVI